MTPALPLHHRATPSTAVLLRRWLCAWIALLTLTQTIGSTLTGLQGTRHHHRPSMQSAAPSVPVIRWRHDDAMRADAHAQMHARGDAHDHRITDASVLAFGHDPATEAVVQLAAVLAPGADSHWMPCDAAHHVQAVTASWSPTTRSITPPLQPPRG